MKSGNDLGRAGLHLLAAVCEPPWHDRASRQLPPRGWSRTSSALMCFLRGSRAGSE
jgi:hypothetical protein